MASLFAFLDTSTVLIALALTLISIIIIRYLFPSASEHALNLPPKGPREWPVIGCIPSLIGDEPSKLFADMSKLYGPFFRTKIGIIPTIVLNDYDSIREAFARSGDDFADRPYFGMIEYITKGKGEYTSCQQGPGRLGTILTGGADKQNRKKAGERGHTYKQGCCAGAHL